jgi:hypothetical protein
MQKAVLLSVGIWLSAACLAGAEDKKLAVTLDLTYTSKWLSKGVEAYGQQGGLFKTIDFDFWGTGFGVNITHRNATSSGYVDNQRLDYRPYFKGILFEGAPHQMNYNISAGYEHYPGLARDVANTTWEWIFAFSWPKLLPGGLVPSYIAHYEYPAGSGYVHSNVTGWVHRFILGYDMKCPELSAPLHLSSEVAYNDGLGGRVHDWAYVTFGASTKLDINKNTAFVPGVYHQVSMDDSICKRDVTYAMLSLKHSF